MTLIIDYPFIADETEAASIPAGLEDGGSTITSLNLQMDDGSGWITIIGENPYSTSTSYTVTLETDGSNMGETFRFRFRARNIHGWGDYSTATEVLAATIPGVIATTSIELVADNSITLAWQIPDENGSPISAYLVEIMDSTGAYV